MRCFSFKLAIPAVLSLAFLLAEMQPSYAKVLLEFYTAQGCQPCQKPGKLTRRVDKGDNFISLEFHVDYWDQLGWVDPFASPEFEKRHKEYIERLSPVFANVPQIIINGFKVATGLNREDAVAKLKNARQRVVGMGFEVSVIKLSDAGIEIDMKNPNEIMTKFDIFVAHYHIKKRTRVEEGALKGKVITNHNIVTKLENVGQWDGKNESRTLATDIELKTGEGIAVFLQEKNLGFIVAADNYEIHKTATGDIVKTN
jgi:hypothetical protein